MLIHHREPCYIHSYRQLHQSMDHPLCQDLNGSGIQMAFGRIFLELLCRTRFLRQSEEFGRGRFVLFLVEQDRSAGKAQSVSQIGVAALLRRILGLGILGQSRFNLPRSKIEARLLHQFIVDARQLVNHRARQYMLKRKVFLEGLFFIPEVSQNQIHLQGGWVVTFNIFVKK